jgi:arylsulfatase
VYSNQDGAKHTHQKKSKWRFVGNEKLTPGKHMIAFDFTYDRGGVGKSGEGTLLVDGKKVAEGRMEKTLRFRFSVDESFDIAQDTGTPGIDEYDAKMPFQFTGTLHKVEFKLGPEKITRAQRGSIQRLRTSLAMAVQ